MTSAKKLIEQIIRRNRVKIKIKNLKHNYYQQGCNMAYEEFEKGLSYETMLAFSKSKWQIERGPKRDMKRQGYADTIEDILCYRNGEKW